MFTSVLLSLKSSVKLFWWLLLLVVCLHVYNAIFTIFIKKANLSFENECLVFFSSTSICLPFVYFCDAYRKMCFDILKSNDKLNQNKIYNETPVFWQGETLIATGKHRRNSRKEIRKVIRKYASASILLTNYLLFRLCNNRMVVMIDQQKSFRNKDSITIMVKKIRWPQANKNFTAQGQQLFMSVALR